MDESITAEDKKRARQKPPLDAGRIAGEIVAGTATGLVALPLAFVAARLFVAAHLYEDDCMGIGRFFSGFVVFFSVFPIVYGPASAIGVYVVGNSADDTGSFLLTLGCGFAGGFATLGMALLVHSSFYWSYWFPRVSFWVFVPLASLILPLMTTCAFNLTRRYKRPVLPRSSGGKYFVSYP